LLGAEEGRAVAIFRTTATIRHHRAEGGLPWQSSTISSS
jgi:hypothetical protein